MKRTILTLLGVGLLFGCSDSASRSGLAPLAGTSVNEISEARFGGNPDFFFAAPLATTPQPGDLNFDVGQANGALVPYMRVCETNGSPGPAGCLTDVTLQVTGSPTGLAMTYNATAQQYQVNWQTKDLVLGTNYRLEVWGLAVSTAEKASTDPRWRFGWIDISNSPSVSSCTGAGEYCLIKYGQTVPVKVRIEQSVFCPVTRNCAVQFVAAGNDARLQATFDDGSGAPSAQLFIPAQDGTNFAIAFEPCTAEENAAVSDAVDIPTFGPCVKTNTTFTGALQVPAIVSLCTELDASSFGLTHEQEHQLALHHLTSDLSRVTALPEAYSCGQSSSGASLPEPNTLMRFARAAGSRLVALVTPRDLYAAASAKRIDRGGGGSSTFVSSWFKLALPSKFEYVIASDATATRLVGSTHTLQAKVTDLFGEPVKNARVRWSVASSPAPGASVVSPTPQLTDASGISTATVQLSTSVGLNIFHASGRGIAASGSECATASPTTLSCNGPRATFDPFTALKVPETDASGQELPVDFAEGTRLPFSILGCSPGFGTATVDGTLSGSEWECARTYNFTANVSGGATPATLYVMNDGSRLYLAVRLQRSAGDKVNKLQFNFDNNNSWKTNGTGAAEAGDDILSFDAATGLIDAFLTGKCANSSQSSCWSTDASDGGTGEGSGTYTNAGGFTTYEISHPLNSADNAHDFSLSAGAKVGLFLTLQTGGGAAGNTQWPGFRQYLEITIQP